MKMRVALDPTGPMDVAQKTRRELLEEYQVKDSFSFKKRKQNRILKPKNSVKNQLERKKEIKSSGTRLEKESGKPLGGHGRPLHGSPRKPSATQDRHSPAIEEAHQDVSISAPPESVGDMTPEAIDEQRLDLVGQNARLRMEMDARNEQIHELREMNSRLIAELDQVKQEIVSSCAREEGPSRPAHPGRS